MKSIILLMCSGMLCSVLTTSAQQITNGGFEPTGSISTCTDITLLDYNNDMGGGNRAIGSATTIRLEDASCSNGNPVEGSHFVALEYSPPFGNTISFKLDKAMTANKEYSFRISYKVPVGITPATAFLKYGYSMDSTTADSLVASEGPITNETWLEDTLTFTPKLAAQYVWIELSTLGGDDYTLHVDDVEMLNIPQSISKVTMSPYLSLTPNPASDYAILTLDANISLPCTIQLHDITGRVITSVDKHISDMQTKIDLANIPQGTYFIQLMDNQQQLHTAKLLVQ